MVGVAACLAFAPPASPEDNAPEVVLNPLLDTCLYDVGTYAGHVPGALRLPADPEPPDIILICHR